LIDVRRAGNFIAARPSVDGLILNWMKFLVDFLFHQGERMASTHTTKQNGPHSAAHSLTHSSEHSPAESAAPHSATDADLSAEERTTIARDFKQVVNMTAAALKKWLDSDDSKRVGFKGEASESVGHQSGLQIVAILAKSSKELTDADYRHMRKVVGYVHRHIAQGPTKQDVQTSDWRYSLMNWGHDPMKR
jgi:hypothetical protein